MNLETTGIIRERVEMMEARMKEDILKELVMYDGKVLLHSEEVVGEGTEQQPNVKSDNGGGATGATTKSSSVVETKPKPPPSGLSYSIVVRKNVT